MYKPDPRIVKYLKQYDADLDARWDGRVERWRITWRGKKAMLVQNDDGSFRPLDERAVAKAALADAWKYRDARMLMKVMDDHNTRITEGERRRAKDDFHQYLREDGYQKVFGVGQKTGRSKYAGWGGGAHA